MQKIECKKLNAKNGMQITEFNKLNATHWIQETECKKLNARIWIQKINRRVQTTDLHVYICTFMLYAINIAFSENRYWKNIEEMHVYWWLKLIIKELIKSRVVVTVIFS